jgi:hypothetical protein
MTMRLEHAFQAGWQDVVQAKPWRVGYHKFAPAIQRQYEEGRLAALATMSQGVTPHKIYSYYDLPARVIVQINDEREMQRQPDVVYGKSKFVPKIVSLT